MPTTPYVSNAATVVIADRDNGHDSCLCGAIRLIAYPDADEGGVSAAVPSASTMADAAAAFVNRASRPIKETSAVSVRFFVGAYGLISLTLSRSALHCSRTFLSYRRGSGARASGVLRGAKII